MLSQIIQRSWYKPFGVVTVILIPFSLLFCALVAVRRLLYRLGILTQTKISVPVIVVGNINVGGTGKTPLTIAIVNSLKEKGYQPGVISRGYGGHAQQWPQLVAPDSAVNEVGDEAVLLATRCKCPMAVGPKRVDSAELLVKSKACDIIVSDDGLQHLAMKRDIEIVVVDGERRFGNGLCLPAGPLREQQSRMQDVDLIVANGNAKANEFTMTLKPESFANVVDNSITKKLSDFSEDKVEAVSGIGNNERFFHALEELKIKVNRHAFPDHYAYRENDIKFNNDLPVLMTEKDAVKCKSFKPENSWYLKVDAELDPGLLQELDKLISVSLNK